MLGQRTTLVLALALAVGCGESKSNSASGSPGGDAGADAADAGAPLPRDMAPITAPVADDCITDVSAGDHTFTCGGFTFLVWVDPMCTTHACGLIFDVHGGTMGGGQMRENTLLHELAPQQGYLVVHPSATPDVSGGSWDLQNDPPVLGDFMDRMIEAFHVDEKRVHVTGFSQGSAVTFWFLCHKNAVLASTAPISGQSATGILAPNGDPCIEFIDDAWQPRVPILFMSGTADTALLIDDARARVDGLVERLGLTGGDTIDSDPLFRRKHWEDGDGMALDYIEHDYDGQPALAGHCVPGGRDLQGAASNLGLNATTCPIGDNQLPWGEVALEWFMDHPKP